MLLTRMDRRCGWVKRGDEGQILQVLGNGYNVEGTVVWAKQHRNDSTVTVGKIEWEVV